MILFLEQGLGFLHLLLQVDVWLLLLHLNVQENNDARDVVDYVVFFLLPSQVRLTNDSLSCLFSVLALVIRKNNFGDIFVLEEFPDSISGQNYEAVIGREIQFKDFCNRNENKVLTYLVLL